MTEQENTADMFNRITAFFGDELSQVFDRTSFFVEGPTQDCTCNYRPMSVVYLMDYFTFKKGVLKTGKLFSEEDIN